MILRQFIVNLENWKNFLKHFWASYWPLAVGLERFGCKQSAGALVDCLTWGSLLNLFKLEDHTENDKRESLKFRIFSMSA